MGCWLSTPIEVQGYGRCHWHTGLRDIGIRVQCLGPSGLTYSGVLGMCLGSAVLGIQCLEYGALGMVLGVWCLGYGVWGTFGTVLAGMVPWLECLGYGAQDLLLVLNHAYMIMPI